MTNSAISITGIVTVSFDDQLCIESYSSGHLDIQYLVSPNTLLFTSMVLVYNRGT